MLTTLRIAFRNTSRQRRRTALLAGAIGFGFMTITFLNGMTAGVEDSIRVNFASLLGGHVYIEGEEMLASGRTVSSIQHPDAVIEATTRVGADVTAMSRRSRAQADLIFGSRTTLVSVEGVDFAAEPEVIDALEPADGRIAEMSERASGILLPVSAAEHLQAVPGEIVILRTSTVTGQSAVEEFELVGTFEANQEIGITRAYVHLPALNELIGLEPDNVQSLNLYLADAASMNRVADELTAVLEQTFEVVDRDEADTGFFARFGLGGTDEEPWEGVRYEVTTLEDVLGQVLAILETVDLVALAVFLTLLLITMVGITNTYRMVVMERQSEIGTMRALGMHRYQVRNMFLSEAIITSLLGAAAGAVLAAVLIFLASSFTITSPQLRFITQNGHLAFIVSAGVLARNALIVVVMSALAALLPAQRAARMRPVEALQATA